MSIQVVKINSRGGSQFTLAAAQARAIADEGDCAKIHYTNDPQASEAAYVWKRHGSYVVESATLIEPSWTARLRNALPDPERNP